jgi:predicted SprT family Zn-dependent metalloprotease
MNLNEAQQLANDLLREHGLAQKGWTFEFDQAKRRFGVCRYRSKRIGLSQPLTEANHYIEVVDTILHEIAHALVGPGQGHNNVWKRKCMDIGAKPQRCYTSEDVVTVAGKYRAVCGACGKSHSRHKRIPRGRQVACLCQNYIKDWSKKQILEYKVAR